MKNMLEGPYESINPTDCALRTIKVEKKGKLILTFNMLNKLIIISKILDLNVKSKTIKL